MYCLTNTNIPINKYPGTGITIWFFKSKYRIMKIFHQLEKVDNDVIVTRIPQSFFTQEKLS